MTGRHARAVRSELIDQLEASGAEPPDYPLPRLFLRQPLALAGEGGVMAGSQPARGIVAALDQETSAALDRLGR